MSVTTIKFSPKSGYSRDWREQMISDCTADGALEMGLVVAPDANKKLAVANDYGYFLMQEITADGPTELELITGYWQWHEVKAGKPASILIPVEGSHVYTKHVSQGNGQVALAKGQICDLVNGAFVTNAQSATPKGKIIELPADNGSVLYVVEVMNV